MNKYELNQKLEIHGLIDPRETALNGDIVIVLALPGYDTKYPKSYGVLANDGLVHAVDPKHVRPFPPTLPGGRKDLDNLSSWESFDTATGLDSSKFRFVS